MSKSNGEDADMKRSYGVPSNGMSRDKVVKILNILREKYGDTEMHDSFSDDRYKFLVAIMLSARSRDSMTIPVAKRLFELADTPEKMARLDSSVIESVLRPIGFYKSKTRYVLSLSRQLIEEFGGVVPSDFDSLVKLSGVGRKTANVFLAGMFGRSVIGVDVHVHRISNRIGFVRTKTNLDTEMELYKVIPKEYWSDINRILVNHGQSVCRPVNPMCDVCPVRELCKYYVDYVDNVVSGVASDESRLTK